MLDCCLADGVRADGQGIANTLNGFEHSRQVSMLPVQTQRQWGTYVLTDSIAVQLEGRMHSKVATFG